GDPVDGGGDVALGAWVARFGWWVTAFTANRVQLRSTAPLAHFVERRVGRDPVGPRREARPPVERADPADDANQRLLGRVVSVRGRAGHTPAHGADAVVVRFEQRVHGC